jgi:hypothetical protein
MAAMMADASPGGCLRQPDRHGPNFSRRSPSRRIGFWMLGCRRTQRLSAGAFVQEMGIPDAMEGLEAWTSSAPGVEAARS